MSCKNCKNCKTNKPLEDKIVYAMVRIDSEQPIDKITSMIEQVEKNISVRTRIDVIQTFGVNPEFDLRDGQPVIHWPN